MVSSRLKITSKNECVSATKSISLKKRTSINRIMNFAGVTVGVCKSDSLLLKDVVKRQK